MPIIPEIYNDCVHFIGKIMFFSKSRTLKRKIYKLLKSNKLMPVIMPFGKHYNKSIEQIALADYSYFYNFLVHDLLANEKIYTKVLEQRIAFVEHNVNNFVSVKHCVIQGCDNPAKIISIYQSREQNTYTQKYYTGRHSDTGFIYCSHECFTKDPHVTDQLQKVDLREIAFHSALSDLKSDTKELVEIMAECMGIRKTRRTKKYLEEFFNTL